ncbi:precorrin-3B synthase [Nocardia sp. CNY236]|uniref:precorrin-3B synthase n=1 Tax=Nocardia sp. CNY236 TaxID=1169152 RepID=UPI000688B60E|nr:precorrin-3B synthase [Nocardia sp. CNY236]
MTRRGPDSCPGVLRLHEAADGPLARIRVPGGRLESAQMHALAQVAQDAADGPLELTARGNVQVRGVHDVSALTRRLTEVGMVPSRTHERVRNIVASPLSGRIGGGVDVHPLAAALDAGILAAPRLADLPGRVLFTLDDGRGDVSGLGADIGVHALAQGEFALVLAGSDSGVRLAAEDVVEVVLAAAHAFLELRGNTSNYWRLSDIEHGSRHLIDRLGCTPTADRLEFTATPSIPIGWLEQNDGLIGLGAGVRLGTLSARTAEFLAATERPTILTPWRSLVLTDLSEAAADTVVRVLAPMGLIFDRDSPWLLVSACAGLPGCAKSHADVRADAAAAVGTGRMPPETAAGESTTATQDAPRGRQHWSGCERRCGRPRGQVTDIVATHAGYRIDRSSSTSTSPPPDL